MKIELSWAEKLAYIQKYKPTAAQIECKLHVSQDEIQTATQFIKPRFKKDFGNIFVDDNVIVSRTRVGTKKQRQKTFKTVDAFKKIPPHYVKLTEFAEECGVSKHVLIQHNRFNKTNKQVTVKTINHIKYIKAE